MTITRILETFFYELVDFVPNLILALVPFRDYIRLSKGKVIGAAAALYLFLSLSRILALHGNSFAAALTVAWTLLYLSFYRISIRAELTKLLFVLLIILNYGSFTIVICSYIGYHRLSAIVKNPYSIYVSLIYAGVLLISYPFVYRFMDKKVKPLIQFSENNKIWRWLWLIPATFCLSYYYNLYANGGIINFSVRLSNVLFAAAYNAGAFFVAYVVVRLVEESNESLRLKAENYQLSIQTIQYENLKNRMEESRRARHDLRQSVAVIQSYLKDDNKGGLQEYIEQFHATLPEDATILYCDNYALNALIVYYEDMAKKNGIRFNASIQYPQKCSISDADLIILFGNLLENAIEACLRQKQASAFISLLIQTSGNAVIAALDNSYGGTIQKTKEGYQSAKEIRTGIGITSIERIAEKYHGFAKFEYDEHVFQASISLYPE